MQINVEYITPQVAAEYLKRNTMNRPINQSHLKHLCRQMRDGLWKDNGDSIRFAKTGELMDGQHRLWAICHTGKGQQMVVVRGLSNSAFKTIDSGSKRTPGDVLSLAGYSNANHAAAIGRMILLMRKIGNPIIQGPGGSYSPSAAEILSLVESDSKVVDAANFASREKFLNQHMSPSGIGFLHYSASVLGQREIVEDFFSKVSTVTPDSISTPAYLLREKLLQNKGAREKMKKADLVALAFRAYRYFRDGKNIKLLKPVMGASKRDSGAFDL